VRQLCFYGWIPVLTGLLRFSDCYAANKTSLAQMGISAQINAPNADSSAKWVSAVVQLFNTDEKWSVRKTKDIHARIIDFCVRLHRTKKPMNIRVAKGIYSFARRWDSKRRSRLQTFVFSIPTDGKSVGSWKYFAGDATVRNILIRSKNALLASPLSKKDHQKQFEQLQNSQGETASGDLTVRRSGFIRLSVNKLTVKSQDLQTAKAATSQDLETEVIKIVANQVYFALKPVFHRHRFHDSYSDGILKVNPVSNNDVAVTTPPALHEWERIGRRLARAVTIFHVKTGESLSTVRLIVKSSGFLAYLKGMNAAVAVEFQEASKPLKVEQPVPATASGISTRNVSSSPLLSVDYVAETERANTSSQITHPMTIAALEQAIAAKEREVGEITSMRIVLVSSMIAGFAGAVGIWQIFAPSTPSFNFYVSMVDLLGLATLPPSLDPAHRNILSWVMISAFVAIVGSQLLQRYMRGFVSELPLSRLFWEPLTMRRLRKLKRHE
jgi:hypothetical protein